MSAIDALFSSDPFPRRENGRFIPALRECARIQERRFPLLRRLYAREKFDPRGIRTERDVRRLPFLHVSVFKENDFKPAGGPRIQLTLTSSGTSGQKSQNRLDADSLRRVKKSARSVYGALGMVAPETTANYVCMTYDPRQAKDLGTAFTDELLTSFTGRGEVWYAIRRSKGGPFVFDLDGTLDAFRRFGAAGRPVRVLGFPAHLYFTLKAWRERKLPPLRLGRDSWVLTGGGWKGHQGEAIPKDRFKAEVSEWLGLPAANIRDLYGLVEHGIPYVECRLGRMHVPNYARVIVRDPETARPLPYGRRGLPQLITPYLTSYPSFSVLAGDWAELRPRCACGTPGEVLVLHGRAGKSPAKGCAVTAAELLSAAAAQ
ncbi:MAG: LuxE/PaaK family acyltransferase [Solirubrobacteraceae bacterium]